MKMLISFLINEDNVSHYQQINTCRIASLNTMLPDDVSEINLFCSVLFFVKA